MNFVWSYAYEVQNQEDNILLGALKEKIRLIKIKFEVVVTSGEMQDSGWAQKQPLDTHMFS